MEWRPGYCERTSGPGDCAAGAKGSWELPQGSSWANVSAACVARCRACPRCAAVSISLRHRDCSWFARCDTSRLFHDVKSFFTARVRAYAPRPPHARRRQRHLNGTGELSDPMAPNEEAERLSSRSPFRMVPLDATRDCEAGAPSPDTPPSVSSPAPACVAAGSAAPLMLVLGVISAPANARLRDAARRSWMRGAPATVLSCFAIGLDERRIASPAIRTEAQRHRDVLLVGGERGSMYEASFGFWRRAARLFRGAKFVAKTDDDAVVDAAALAAQLALLRACPQTSGSIFAGHFYFGGFNPHSQKICSWTRGWQPVEYRAWGCAESGAFPPVPCAMGALELASADLARWMSASREVHRAMAHAISVERAQRSSTAEDTNVGFWISRSPQRETLTYVRLGWKQLHDVKCAPTDGAAFPSRVPERNGAGGGADPSLVVHKLKAAPGVRYVWSVLRGDVVLDAARCRRAMASR